MADTRAAPVDGIGRAGAGGLAPALVRAARPRQWAKNALVLAAPAAAGVLDEADALASAAVAFLAFSLAASGAYYLNDATDVEADRCHPVKCRRPMAAGLFTPATGRLVALVLVGAGIATALAVSPALAAVVAAYVAVAVAYSTWLKTVAVVDLAAVASGFVLRAVGGAVAVHVPVSDWFLIVAMFGSLFVVAGKRSAEHDSLADGAAAHRRTLGEYTPEFLRFVRVVAAVVVIVAYALFAFERADLAASAVPWFEASVLPFVLAVLRYALLVETGQGGAPEDVVLGDRPLQAMGATWAVVFLLGVELAG